MSFFKSATFQFLILSLSLILPVVRGDCYYPDGTNATDFEYQRCTSGSGASSCCIPSEGDVCLSNGLCWYAEGPYPFRGACTDKTWKSPECPQYCVANQPDEYISLTSCGGTKWCCSDTSSCCSKPNLVFDIGVPSVINDYGAAASTGALSDMPTTAYSTIITAAATGGATVAVITTTNSAGRTITSTQAASAAIGTTVPSLGSTATTSKGLIIGVAAGVIVLLVLAAIVGVLICCIIKRKKRNNATPPVDLIDMNMPSQPQQLNTASNAQLVQKPGAGYYTSSGTSNPAAGTGYAADQKHSFDPVPAYTPPQFQHPTDAHGNNLVELQSPIIPGRPFNQQHGPVYEMN